MGLELYWVQARSKASRADLLAFSENGGKKWFRINAMLEPELAQFVMQWTSQLSYVSIVSGIELFSAVLAKEPFVYHNNKFKHSSWVNYTPVSIRANLTPRRRHLFDSLLGNKMNAGETNTWTTNTKCVWLHW